MRWAKKANENNKPEQANLNPDSVSACIDFGARHVRYMKGQIDGRTNSQMTSEHPKERSV